MMEKHTGNDYFVMPASLHVVIWFDIFFSLGNKPFAKLEDVITFHMKNAIPIGAEQALLKRPIKHKKTLYKTDDLEVLNELGEGNFGKVYKVRIKSENRFCAMKTMLGQAPREVREMFMR